MDEHILKKGKYSESIVLEQDEQLNAIPSPSAIISTISPDSEDRLLFAENKQPDKAKHIKVEQPYEHKQMKNCDEHKRFLLSVFFPLCHLGLHLLL